MYIQHITVELDQDSYHSCLHGNAKNFYWFKKLVSAPLGCCGFSVRVKPLLLRDLTSAKATVHKKHQFREKVAKMVTKQKLKLNKFIWTPQEIHFFGKKAPYQFSPCNFYKRSKTCLKIFKFRPSASPKLLNLNQEYLSKIVVFQVKSF